ncbi:hypothetical protein CSA17_05625 [bacterium DOLJORAL78_65_58]|nr:MAG: hypothetical protein CSB20_13795 [bacterium DOLZORAL124_64_63]PIE75792.1 MAG: hypothetical protein CSA17_05625 [bacterium DOLJORAL78_65_58]
MLRHNKRMLAFFLNLSLVLCCLAATLRPGAALAQRYLVQTYQEWDGLPANQVMAATQDSSGSMWFATRVGLVRYDGEAWTMESIHDAAVPQVEARLKTDSQGRLWAASCKEPPRISVCQDGRWRVFTDLRPYTGFDIAGLEVLEAVPGRNADLVALITVSANVIIWQEDRWQNLPYGSLFGPIHATTRIGTTLYLAAKNGLFALDLLAPDQPPRLCPGLPQGDPVYYMAPDTSGQRLWLVGPTWIRLWQDGTTVSRFGGLDLLSPSAQAQTHSLADRAGGLFFGSLRGLNYFHPQTGLETLNRHNGLISDGTTGMIRDREGNTWILSSRGLSKIVSRRFQGYNRQSGLLKNEVSAIIELPDGTIALGHEGGVTFLDDDIRFLAWGDDPERRTRVMDFELDARGRLWAATDRRGVVRISRQGEQAWQNAEAGLKGQIYSLHFTPRDTLWVAGSNGLFRREGERFVQVRVPLLPAGYRQFFRRIVSDNEGGFYLATALLGVFHYRDGHFTHHPPRDGEAGRNVFNILPEPDGETWIGSSSGLFRLEGGEIVRSRAPHPQLDRPVYSIIRDRTGRYWYGTDLGVMVWDGRRMRHLTLRHGLLGNECNRDALTESRDGRIWIGTDGGASAYRAPFDLAPEGRPLVSIHGFRVNGQEVGTEEELILNQPPQTLEVLFSGSSFLDENTLGFRLFLENFDEDWLHLGPDHAQRMNYIQVPAGHYRFHVQAVRSDGAVSRVALSPWITIRPPLLARWSVRLGMVLILVVLIWGIFALVSGRRYAQRLEDEVRRQTQDLRRSEQSIKAESYRLAATLQNISDGVLAVDADGIVALANPAVQNILGQDRNPVGQELKDLLPLDWSNVGRPSQQIPHPHRPRTTLEISVTPVETQQPNQYGQVVVLRDITDRLGHEAEQIRTQKLESLGVFAGGLAHDFNNLLTVMLGNISVLEDAMASDDENAQMLAMIREASQRARNLTNQLLTFARGGEPLLERACIAHIVRQSLEFSLSGTNVRCEMELDHDLYPVEVDPGQIDQVLANLTLNAVQAMPDGGILKVRACNLGTAEHPLVMVELADQGCGIAEEDRARIFDPYFTTKPTGSGLGLAIAYSIVTRHGGHITMESEVGRGTTFRIFLQAWRSGGADTDARTDANAAPKKDSPS